MQSLRSALCDHWLYDLESCLNHLYHSLDTGWNQSHPHYFFVTGNFLILAEDLWISANRLRAVKDLKVERGNSKTARGGLLALIVAKDRQEGAQWMPGDLPG